MRYFITYGPVNGFYIDCIVLRANSKNAALNQGIENCKGLSDDFIIKGDTPKLIDAWNTKLLENKRFGKHDFCYTIVYLNGDRKQGITNGQGIKTAFTNLFLDEGKSKNIRVIYLYKKAEVKKKGKSTEAAKKVLSSQTDTIDLFSNAQMKASNCSNLDVRNSIPLLFDLTCDVMKGRYKVPIPMLLTIIAALVYFVAPSDFIPDFIPVVGQADDVAILSFVINKISKDLETYKGWKIKMGEYM